MLGSQIGIMRASSANAERSQAAPRASWFSGSIDGEPIADAWVVEISPPVRQPVTIRAVRTVAFAGTVPVPLAWIDGANRHDGTVTIREAGRFRPRILNHRLAELPPRSATFDRAATIIGEFAFDAGRGHDGDPVPAIDFHHDVRWVGADGEPVAYGKHGELVAGLRGTATWTLAGGRTVTVEAEGHWDRPYEPHHRGGLNQMKVRTDDGREGTAIFEVAGAHHWKMFPDTDVSAPLPW